MTFFRNNRTVVTVLLIAFIALTIQDLILVIQCYAQSSGEELLKKGIQHYTNAEFEFAIETLQHAIQKGLKEKDDIIQAHKYLAFSYAAIGDDQNSKLTYLKLLEVYPLFDLLLSESPRLRKPLEQAKKEFVPKDAEPPVIKFALPATVNENTVIQLSAEVTDASGVEVVNLFYKESSDKEFTELLMTKGTGDQYSATIPAEEVTLDGIELYIQAKDKAGNEPALKGNAENPLRISVQMVDKEMPVITHTPVTTTQENTDILIEGQITDRSGVNQAVLFYRKVGEAKFTEQSFEAKEDNKYIAKIPAKIVTGAGVEYYFQATDKAGNPSALKGSAEKPFQVAVSIVDEQPPVVEHTLITSAKEKEPLKISVVVTDRSGVSEVNLFYKPADAKNYNKLKMKATGNNQYIVEIPGESVMPGELAYYIQANDNANNQPAFKGTEQKPLVIKVTRFDQAPPKITHSPIAEIIEREEVDLTAIVIDNVDVALVKLYYRQKGKTTYHIKEMVRKKNDTYQTKLKAEPEGIEYYLEAQDISGNKPSLWRNAESPQLILVKSKPQEVLAEQKPEAVPEKKVKKGGKKWLWITLGAAAVGGTVLVAVMSGGGEETGKTNGDSKLPDPPSNPK